MMRVNTHKKRHALATISFGVVKVVVGLFMIWGQWVFAERGTLYGFYWPHSLHDLLANWRTIVLFVVAGWLIYTGIWGTKPKDHTTTLPD
jgi:hypothetical protein